MAGFGRPSRCSSGRSEEASGGSEGDCYGGGREHGRGSPANGAGPFGFFGSGYEMGLIGISENGF